VLGKDGPHLVSDGSGRDHRHFHISAPIDRAWCHEVVLGATRIVERLRYGFLR
jgi:hypothetical protein